MTRDALASPRDPHRRLRDASAVIGAAALFACLVPPVATWARRYEFVQAIQFCVFAVSAPVLLVVGAPWRHLGLSSVDQIVMDSDGTLEGPSLVRPVDRLALARLSRSGHARAVVASIAFSLACVVWRLSPLVNALAHHGILVLVEALTLGASGVALWLSMIDSPPLRARTPRNFRLGMAAAAMWTIWVTAYLFAQSHSSWYPAFHHVAGRGVSEAADQQISAGVMWLLSASAFVPLIFWNLVQWLQSEDDPSEELFHILRQQRVEGSNNHP